jgi:hypothetical protein
MRKGIIKKAAIASMSLLVLLTCILSIHIYIVTRHKAPDANTVALARIDMKQDITQADADKIGKWLSVQKGVEHYLCNTSTGIIIFSFHPAAISANDVTNRMCATLHYKGVRYVPSEAEMKGGCPVATTSISYKAYSFIKNIF